MIPAIGVMIAAYIITRMVASLTKPDVNKVAKVLAVLTIVVTVISVMDLMSASSSVRNGMPALMR
ncbi:hypothetical protein BBB39_09090 [Bordetella trematum]|uniref:Uncharacterized protein n=1 Tax=Bordetella trematum TaxID=123899 RepID=A0A157SQJ6_9BORD|nr:hypothetical protein [Bordetella trematum]AZR93907.1 hypothetical protein BBB39_09090 [Bordetella trematum]NNH19036.1 hypothetical protein [Bordetella trematum]SAI42820.1 Uncharacterised protein [Bordetella trematum]SAI72176.1 Uncharacterised protein [Bordetella trematum]SUV97948.1 Uncharacterised protein [Bordetella trematum]